MNIEIKRYTSPMKREWDEFVARSANGTFLFQRDYMEYHNDRFDDHSLVACDGGKILALLPANIVGGTLLQSHGGLTYGGWVCGERHFSCVTMLRIWEDWERYCRAEGISTVEYKPVPYIYHSVPRQEDLYALYRNGGVMSGCNISSVIDLRNNPGFNQMKRRQLKQGRSLALEIRETDDYATYWEILTDCLDTRHGASPVHTLEEMERLHRLFPANIRLFAVYEDGDMEGGVVIYDCGVTVHCQYIASTPRGREANLLTMLFDRLIHVEFADRAYFDMGTSNEHGGLVLNEGLLTQKTGMGGSGVAYERYRIDF